MDNVSTASKQLTTGCNFTIRASDTCPPAAMMSSPAFPLILATYCRFLCQQLCDFTDSFISPWFDSGLTFNQTNFLIQLPKAYLIIWTVWWKKMGCTPGVTRYAKAGFPPHLFYLCKSFCFCSEDKTMMQQRWWFSAVEKKILFCLSVLRASICRHSQCQTLTQQKSHMWYSKSVLLEMRILHEGNTKES